MSNFTFELDDFAEEEFYNIINYYKQFDQALSADFIQEFDQTVKQLIAFPKAGNPISPSRRNHFSTLVRIRITR